MSAAKNPGESSTATRCAGLQRLGNWNSTYQKYVTVTATTWVAAALVIAALAPPALLRHGEPLAAMSIWAFFSKLCHQRADRVLHIFGFPTAVCLRCLGIYAGAAVGSLFRLNGRLALRCLGVAFVVNIADVTAEFVGLHSNLPLLRLLIGATLGFAGGAMLSARFPLAKSLPQTGTPPGLR